MNYLLYTIFTLKKDNIYMICIIDITNTFSCFLAVLFTCFYYSCFLPHSIPFPPFIVYTFIPFHIATSFKLPAWQAVEYGKSGVREGSAREGGTALACRASRESPFRVLASATQAKLPPHPMQYIEQIPCSRQLNVE